MNVVRIIIVLLLFGGFGKGYSQTWDSLIIKSIEYLNANDTIRAQQYAEKAIAVAIREYGSTHENYGFCLSNLGAINQVTGQNEKALPLYLKSLSIIEKTLGKFHHSNGVNLIGIGLIYSDMGHYENALPLYLEAIENAEINFGKSHPDYETRYNSLGFLYLKMGQFEMALPIFIKILEQTERIFGKSHPEYESIINILADLYINLGQHEKAVQIYLDELETKEKFSKKGSLSYAINLKHLAGIYKEMAQFENAKKIYKAALEIAEKAVGIEHPEYIFISVNLAGLYKALGYNDKALLIYKNAIVIIEKVFGKDHLHYGKTLNNLAGLYENTGQYENALSFYVEALNNTEKNFGKEHPEYGTSLSNLAGLYQEMGQHEKALIMYMDVLNIFQKTLGLKHHNYGTILNDLGNLYQEMGQYEKALPFHLDALLNTEKALGKEHPDYGIRLNNLAGYYTNVGHFSKALSMYQDALLNTEKNLGKNHSDYISILSNIAPLYERIGKYDTALTIYLEVLSSTKKIIGKEHPDIGNRLNNLAGLYQKIEQYEKAYLLIQEAIENTYIQINQNFSFLTEKEKDQFYKTVSYDFDAWLSFFNRYSLVKPEVAINSYDIELTNKGMILQSGIQMRNAILASDDPKSLEIFDTWTSYKNMLAKEYSKPILERRSDIKEVVEKAESMEAELTKISSSFSALKKLGKIKWQEIQTNLDANKVAIEFSSFRYRNNKEWTDSTLYVANILRKEDAHPHIVYLFKQKQIDSLLERNVAKESSFINKLYSDRKMYELIWKPIESYLQKGDQIFFAPSGILNQLNLGAICISDTTYLSDKYTFHQVSSTAVLASDIKNEKSVEEIAIFGGIEFDAKEDEITQVLTKVPKEHEYVSRGLYLTDATRAGKWTYLDGTLQEAKNIDALAKESQTPTYLYSGTEAVEEHFKNLSGKKSPSVIHIATHGFFFPDPKSDKQKMNTISFQQENTFTLADNPLNRSGLLFAGGNKAWIGDTITTNREDGILTAYEVSNLSLFNTELVVLSACETGLGDIKGSEGVYGLQRAFKMAGARYLIMSLWKVPDIATKEFMTTFYTEYLTNQKPVREAFNVTQTKMKNKYRNEPYKWGGFVLME
jgi:CHAT domain-containing protein/Tfp pilus assembly protein PilF